MNKAILVCFFISLISCKKDPSAEPPFVASQDEKYVLKGIHSFNNIGDPVEPVGNPDDVFQLDSTSLSVYAFADYPLHHIIFSTRRFYDSLFTYSVAHAIYPDAPIYYKIYGNYRVDSVMYPTITENQHLTGKEVIRRTLGTQGHITNTRMTGLEIDLTSFPKGFYKFFLETNTGARFQVGLYNPGKR